MIRVKYLVSSILIMLVIIMACNKKLKDPDERPKEDPAIDSLKLLAEGSDYYELKVNPEVAFQQIDNFGTSDCWSVQFVGNWPESKTNVMADWLFSLDTTNNGQPLGIGLSAWRFNIGAGSAEQGDNSGISDEWRRSECFLLPNGNYNWNKQIGQQWFLRAAKERGVEQFIGFSNSPPVYFTKNGKTFGDADNPQNISLDKLTDYSKFLTEVVNGIKSKTGIELDYVSPFNEPQWEWTGGGQEGTYLQNNTFRKMVETLDLNLAGTGSKILVSEAAEWTYLYTNGDEVGNQIDYFFGAESNVSDAPNLARNIAGHSYYTTVPETKLKNTREAVWNKSSTISNLKVWSTEYCPLGNGDLQALGWNSWKKDLTMDVALYVARIIYHDLVYANVSAWQWWLAISPYNYPDGLIYVSKDKVNGTYTDSRLMWTLGNFSRFVRPGAIRIQTVIENEQLKAVSFENIDQLGLSIILINPTDEPQPVKIIVDGNPDGVLRPYITSDSEYHKLLPLKKIDVSNAFEVPQKSVITFTLKK